MTVIPPPDCGRPDLLVTLFALWCAVGEAPTAIERTWNAHEHPVIRVLWEGDTHGKAPRDYGYSDARYEALWQAFHAYWQAQGAGGSKHDPHTTS